MYIASLLLTGVALAAGLPQQDLQQGSQTNLIFNCPKLDGTYEDEYQCDLYWVCKDGKAKEVLCDDGLVFDISKADQGIPDPCESPYVVDCGNRLEMQEPTFPSEFCPRRNGIFPDPDPAICGRFHTCIKGQANPTDCSGELHFDETTGNCAWPDAAGRTGCRSTRDCLGDFCCDGIEQLTADGVPKPHPTYPHPADCQKFYVCLGGKKPQESSCGAGEVFSEKTRLCDYPENVPECTGWFKDDPNFAHYYDFVEARGGKDVGALDHVG